jgi:hypothetical protein
MNTSQKFVVQIATVGGLLGGMVIALAITKDYQKAKTYGLVLGTLGAVVGYGFAKKSTENLQ